LTRFAIDDLRLTIWELRLSGFTIESIYHWRFGIYDWVDLLL